MISPRSFALDENCPLALFASLWTNWTSVRKVRDAVSAQAPSFA